MAQTRSTDEELSVCAINIRALQANSKLSVNAWAKRHGLTQSTIARIISGDLDPTSKMLSKIADACGLFGWQLMVPNFDPANPPVLREATQAERMLYARLKQTVDQLAELREATGTRPGDLDEFR